MRIGILKERRAHEARVAASPDSVEKLLKAGCSVVVESGAGNRSTIGDDAFVRAGANIAKTAADVLKKADIILKVQAPLKDGDGRDEISLFQPGQTLICHMNALGDPKTAEALAKAGIRAFALELLPRITRAQSMDILSSQSNIAGYKSVLDALEYYPHALPMMSTAAGRVPPAHVFVMGVGVAGLQAIATAKRLGAIVMATDVRPATKEQVESLGGKFIAVENEEFVAAQGEGGYAREMSDSYKALQAELIAKTLPQMNIVITTALIPGRPAPVLVTQDHVKAMKPGAVIVDMAVEAGGNCPLSEYGRVVEKHGVTLIGHGNIASRLAGTASPLFARNLLNFLTPLLSEGAKELTLDREDEIIQQTLICENGEIVSERLRQILSSAKKATGKTTSKKQSKKGSRQKTLARKTAAKK